MAETLRFEIVVDDKGSTTIKQFTENVKSSKKEVEGIGAALNAVKTASLVYLAKEAFNVAKAFYQAAQEVTEFANNIQRTANLIGMSTTQWQQWTYAAKMADVEVETLKTGFKFLSRNMQEAAEGGKISGLFERMGVAIKDATGNLRPLDETMGDIMDKFASWEEGPRKIAIALQLFGRSGEELIPFLNLGRTGIEEFKKAAEALGIVLSPEMVKRLSEAENSFKNFNLTMERVKREGLAPFAESLSKVIDLFLDFNKWLRENKTTDWFPWMEKVSKWFKDNSIWEWFDKWGIKKKKFDMEMASYTPPKHLEQPPAEYEGPKAKEIIDAWEAIVAEANKVGEVTVARQELIEAGWNKVENALSKLGVTSTNVLQKAADDALGYFATVEAAYQKGETSLANYVNALEAATAKMKQLTGEQKDTSKERVDTEVEYQNKVRELQERYPERGQEYQRQLTSLIDQNISRMKQLKAEEKPPIKTEADVSPALAEFNKIKTQYDSMVKTITDTKIKPGVDDSVCKAQMDGVEYYYNTLKDKIEKRPIVIKIQQEKTGGGGADIWNTEVGGMLPYMTKEGTPTYEKTEAMAEGGLVTQPTMALLGEAGPELVVPLRKVMQGLSLKAVGEIVKYFGGEAGASVLNSMADIEQMKTELGKLKKRETMIGQLPGQMSSMASWYGGSPYVGQAFMLNWQEAMNTLGSQVKQLEYRLTAEALQVASKYGNIIKSFESGGYVPKTGLYRLHEGEQVIPKNVNMGGITVNVPRGTSKQQAMEVIKELQKALKYKQVELS